MAIQNNTPTENQVEFRDVRRNSSNQIVSYTLEEDSGKQYGTHKVPAVTSLYEKDSYNRTIPQLSSELIVPLPDIPLEVISQTFVDEANIYVQGISIKGSDVEEVIPEDVFSGRYELTPNAASYRGKESPGYYDNTHFSGISYHNGGVRDATDNFILFPGFKEVLWDNAVFGPPLTNGGYRVTKELIESGRNLNLRTVIGFSINKGNSNVNANVRIIRKRIPSDPANVREVNNGTYAAAYPMIELSHDIPNADLVENDIYEVQTVVGSRDDGVHIMGDKCIFEVTAQLPEEEPIVWPNAGTSTLGDAPSGGNANDEASDDATSTGA